MNGPLIIVTVFFSERERSKILDFFLSECQKCPQKERPVQKCPTPFRNTLRFGGTLRYALGWVLFRNALYHRQAFENDLISLAFGYALALPTLYQRWYVMPTVAKLNTEMP